MAGERSAQHLDTFHRFGRELIRQYTLESVLFQVTEAAKKIAGAGFAAVGVVDVNGGLEWFAFDDVPGTGPGAFSHPAGVEQQIAAIRRLRTTVRLPDLDGSVSREPAAGQDAEKNPFLGAPILLQDEEIGQLYLTAKIGGEFTAHDQQMIETLAAFAAVAIEHARSYGRLKANEDELAQRNQELAIFNDVSVAASTTLEVEGILATTLDRMMLHFNARCGEVYLAEEERDLFHLEMRKGETQSCFWEHDRFRSGQGFLGRVAATKDLLAVNDPPGEPEFLQEAFRREGLRMLIGIPLVSKGLVLGVMALALREPRELSDRQRVLMQAVGLSVGTALENGLLHRKGQRLAVLEERERIGMDLHDGIIQSIYAVGLMLEEGMLELDRTPGEVRGKLQGAVDGLNEVIRDIRAYILDLRPRRLAFDNVAAGLASLAHEFRVNSLASIETDLSEEAARICPPGVANTLFHIAQEALANAARHARATRVQVSLRREEGGVALTVDDNGCGFDPALLARSRGHGLENMEERARTMGGEIHIRSKKGTGTRIDVNIPLEITE